MSPIPQDPPADFIRHLQSRYGHAGPAWLPSAHDLERWTGIVGSTRHTAYNTTARQLGVGFHEADYPSGFVTQ